jgi:hypothetical protein
MIPTPTNAEHAIAKDRLQTLTDIFNRSGLEFCVYPYSRAEYYDFEAMIQSRLKSSGLPRIYEENAGTRQFISQMWFRYKKEGICLDSKYLRKIEQWISENTPH